MVTWRKCAHAATTSWNRSKEKVSAPPLSSHRVRGLVAGERAGQVGLDFFLRLATVLVGELHADTCGALALSALRRQPDHAACDRQLLVLTHEVEQHEHLVAE